MKDLLTMLIITLFMTTLMYSVGFFENMTPLTINTLSFMFSIVMFGFIKFAIEEVNE